MNDFKISDTIEFRLAESYDELTLQQFTDIRKEPDEFAILSILTGVDRETLQNIRSVDVELKLLPMLKWLSDKPDFEKLPVPDSVKLGKRDVKIKKIDVWQLTWAQRNMVYKLMQKQQKNLENDAVDFDAIPSILSICLTKIEPSFNDTNYEQAQKDVMQLPITQAYPLAAFFLRSTLQSLKPRSETSRASQAK